MVGFLMMLIKHDGLPCKALLLFYCIYEKIMLIQVARNVSGTCCMNILALLAASVTNI